MKFKKDVDFAKFFQAVKKCSEDILFYTIEGDQLNLSSTLSRFIFSTVNTHEGIISSGRVVCKCEADKELLREFLEERTIEE